MLFVLNHLDCDGDTTSYGPYKTQATALKDVAKLAEKQGLTVLPEADQESETTFLTEEGDVLVVTRVWKL